MKKENYIIGIDVSDGKAESVLTVGRLNGANMAIIKYFRGEEAEEMYERLTDQKVGVIRDEYT